MRIFFVAVIGFFFSFSEVSFAVQVHGLYDAELPVTSQGVDDRDQVIEQGFLQVLVKLSGDPLIQKNYAVKQELNRANYYVQDFTYSAPTTASSQYFIKIRFDKNALNQLMYKAGVPYWGDMRPLILVFMTTAQQSSPEMIGDDSKDPVLDDFKLTAKRYALPIIFPILDTADLRLISADDIQQIALSPLKAAAARYAPAALLIGNISSTPHGYQGNWTLVMDDDRWQYPVEAKTPEEIVQMVLNQVSQTLANRYVAKTDAPPSVWVRLIIDDVKKEKDFKLLMQYLNESGCVKQMQLSQVKGEVVELRIELNSNLDHFMQTALEDEHLVFKDQDKYSNTLTYHWVR